MQPIRREISGSVGLCWDERFELATHFTTGLEMISMESSEPVASEFRKTFEEQNFGLPLRDVLLNLTERVPLMDVRFFVTALLVQKETGGNLAEILDELSRVIRERFRIYREVRVRTAQGRLTAMVLIAMPPSMMALLGLMNPSYMRDLVHRSRRPQLLRPPRRCRFSAQ